MNVVRMLVRRSRAGVCLAAACVAAASMAGCVRPDSPALVVAVSATSAEPMASVIPFMDLLLQRAADAREPASAMVDVIVSGRDDVLHVDLTPMRGDEVEAVPEKARAKANNLVNELAGRVSSLTAGEPGLDALSLLDRAARGTAAGDAIVVETSGIQTVDPLDLRVMGWQFSIARVVDDLVAQKAVPDLVGRDVTFAGLGFAMGTQPVLTPAARSQVEQLWLAICRAGGAQSCTLGPQSLDLTAPLATHRVPVVPIDAMITSCEARTLTVPAAAMFAGDSAVLMDGSRLALASIVDAVKQCPSGAAVSVVGHAADPTPNVVDAQALSTARAHAVWAQLIELGAPPRAFVDVRGVGDTQPKVNNWVNGEFSEPLAALNRRVEVTIQPTR